MIVNELPLTATTVTPTATVPGSMQQPAQPRKVALEGRYLKDVQMLLKRDIPRLLLYSIDIYFLYPKSYLMTQINISTYDVIKVKY